MGRQDVLPEELLAKAIANGYKHGAHHVEDSKRDGMKYVAKTLRDQNIALKRYEKWVIAVDSKRSAGESVSDQPIIVDASYTTGAQRLCEGLPPLDLATIKDFLQFIAAISRGNIDDKEELVTTDSMNTFAEWFFAGFARVTGNRIEEADRRGVYDWVRHTWTQEGLVVNKKKPKHLFGEKELANAPGPSGPLTMIASSILAIKFKSPSLLPSSVGLAQGLAPSSPTRRMIARRVFNTGYAPMMPPTMEFTSGRANVTLPFDPHPLEGNSIDAAWKTIQDVGSGTVALAQCKNRCKTGPNTGHQQQHKNTKQ